MVKRLLVLGAVVLVLGLGTRTEAEQYTYLTVVPNPSGIVNSTGGEINCGNICSHGYDGWVHEVEVVATPVAGYEFSGWTGDCASTPGNVCTLTMDRDHQIGAVFRSLRGIGPRPNPLPSPPRSTLRVLSMGLKCPFPFDCIREQLDLFGTQIAWYRPDILLVREVFWSDVGEYLISAINSNPSGYRLNFYEIRPGGGTFTVRGGTLIATTDLPIENVTSYIFDADAYPDRLANKGVIHLSARLGTRSNGEPVYLRVANTHLQAGGGDGDVRRDQIGELRRYINRAYPMPTGQPLLFGGDFNVAQTDWAADLETWNQLYGTMQSWHLDSVQKMCGDAGETSCQGSSQAAADFQSEIQQLFITQPDTFDSDLAGYKLIPFRYQSVPVLYPITDHPFIIVDFAYQEVSPRKQMRCIYPEVSDAQGSCPDDFPIFRGGGASPRCQVEPAQNCNGYIANCTQVTDWSGYSWAGCYCFDCCCHTWLEYDAGSMACCRMGWFKTTVSNDFNDGRINVNRQTHPSGYSFNQDGGATATLDAMSPQTAGGRAYEFERWEKRDSAGNVVATNPSPSWTITVDGDYTYVAVSKFDASVSGPEELYLKGIGTFAAAVSGGMGPIAYEWRWRQGNPYPSGPWSQVVSTSQTYKATMVTTDFELQLKVADNTRAIYRTKYVKYQAPPCTYSISPSSQYLIASGGTGSFRVTAGSRCFWEAFSKVDWITITSEGDGSGNGTVQYSVTSNTSSTSRTSTLKVAGRSHTVTQGGAPCAYSLSPGSQSLSASGGTGSVSVTAGGGCSWTAVSNADWISITWGSGGSGNGTVVYSVAPNTRPASRAGTLTIAGNTFTVTQAGGRKEALPDAALE